MLASMNISEDIKSFWNKFKILFVVGSHLATDTSKTKLNAVSVINEDFITKIEQEIDKIDEKLPVLQQFGLSRRMLRKLLKSHICRTVARRAEKELWQ